MISYALKCANGHAFDSWFQSAAAFDTLKQAGHVICAQCGCKSVEKAIMAPSVVAARKKAAAPEPASRPVMTTPKAGPDPDLARKLAEMKKQVEANSDYVGDNFAREARSMHLGDSPERPIYGEATAGDAKSLIEDGVPVLPLPFTPTRKTN